MNGQSDVLKLCWEKEGLIEFFRLFHSSIKENLLKEDDINFFLKKLQSTYPITKVLEFNTKPQKEIIRKVLGFEISDSLQNIERQVFTHFLQYLFKECADGNL